MNKQDLALFNQQRLIGRKTEPTNQPTDRILSMGQIELMDIQTVQKMTYD